MKRIFIILLCLTAFYTGSISQTGWEWQNPLPQGNDLFAIHMLDNNHFAIAGSVGIISVTQDGGTTWITTPTGIGSTFRAIEFIDPSNGWVSGDNGTIMRTNDGGISWNNISLTESLYLMGIGFLNSTTGWVCGHTSSGTGKIFKTTDGGTSWTQIFSAEEVWPVSMQLKNGVSPYIVTSDGFLKSTDGGITWEENKFSPRPLYDGYFINDQVGWVVGVSDDGFPSIIYKTTDGGQNWVLQASNTYTDLKSVCFFDENNGRVFGESGRMLSTNDGGTTWIEGEISEVGDYYDADSYNNQMITVSTNAYIYQSIDGGITWEQLKQEVNYHEMYSVEFHGTELGWVAGDYGAILKTTDGGKTWKNVGLNLLYTLKDIEMIDETNGWIAGYISGEAKIIKTTDGGETWSVITPGADLPLISACFRNESLGYFSGSLGVFYKTIDGGNTWQLKNLNTSEFLMCVEFLTDNTGFVCGTNGIILKTTDGAETWTPVTSPVTTQLNKIIFLDQQNGWIVGKEGVFLKTADGGNSWNIHSTTIENDLNSIFFTSADTGWVCGFGGGLFQTTDGGNTWNRERMTYDPLFDLWMIRGNYGWTVGENGIILRKTGPAAPSSSDPGNLTVPSFSASCFPNPATNSTTVEFKANQKGSSSLRILDANGKLVKVYASQPVFPGSNRINVDLKNISPAVYIYEVILTPHGSQESFKASGKIVVQ